MPRARISGAWQAEPVLGHLGINVPDLDQAQRYYDLVMPALGFEPFLVADDELAYRPADGRPGTYLFVYPSVERSDYSRHRTGLQHLAFMVPTRSAVDAVHDLVVGLGSTVVHEPRTYPQYPPPYYATFWLDPFGLMLEAVCHKDRD
jgi:catechol 2,3-dioxygenase-like lactoylglutathione lyase family enzyme